MSILKENEIMMDRVESASNDMPSFLLGFGADAWPAVLLIG